MQRLWDRDTPFIELFGAGHLVYLAGMLLLLVGVVAGRRVVRRHYGSVLGIVTVVVLVQQVALYSWYALETGFDPAEALPLHISRVSTLVGLAYLLTRRTAYVDVLFYFGLFAYGSFLLPKLVYPPTHVVGMSFFVNHAVTILLPVVVAVGTGWRPTVPALWRAYAWFLGYLAVALVANALTGGNYFYLQDRPFLGSWPEGLYVPVALGATLALFWVGYAGSRLLRRDHIVT